MLGRPNLVRLQCEEFTVLFHVEIPSQVAIDALMATHHHRGRDGDLRAYYGKSYLSHGVPHIVEASVFPHEDGEYHLSFRFLQSDRGKPPSSYQSPDTLFDLAAYHAPSRPLKVNFYGTFKYNGDSWTPRPALPFEMPRPLRVARGISFERIDGMRMSKLVDNETRESLQISVSDDGEITHEAGLVREKTINSNMIRSLIREGSRMSLGLVTKKEVTSDGN